MTITVESIYFLTVTAFNIFLPSAGRRRQNNVLQKLSKRGPVADGNCNGVPAVNAATATVGV
jgi:hypothetical protein